MAQADHTDARLARLEEDGAFSERTIEQVSAEVFELSKRLTEIVGRLGRIENKLGGLAETVAQNLAKDDTGDQRPPHSVDHRDDDLKN